jgi:hypothetical protein
MKLPIHQHSSRHNCFGGSRLISALTLSGLAALLAVNAPRPLSADDVSWLSAIDGDWTDAANWSSDPALPGATDNVTIAATTGGTGTDPYTVTFGTGTEADATLAADITSLLVGSTNASDPRARLELNGGTLTVDRGTTAKPVTLENADLTINANATLNFRAGTTGSSNIDGLIMNGGATITIESGGKLQSQLTDTSTTAGTRAGINMLGSANETNIITIKQGATVEVGYTFVGGSGSASGAQNHILVDGGKLSVRSLELGRASADGNGTVTVKNGGTISGFGSGLTIGGGSGQNGSGRLIIGEIDETGKTLSEGTVQISGGSAVLGTKGTGSNAGGTGTITLNAGSLTSTASFILGGSGTDDATNKSSGTINVNGGVFEITPTIAARTMTLARTQNSTGTLNITGGTMNLVRTASGDRHTLILAPGYVDEASTGTATVNLSGGTLNVDKLVSETVAGTINFTGGLFTVKQATVSNGKIFAVGDGSGDKTATLRLVTATGSGDHIFADGLAISANARLEGSGKIASGLATISGTLAATGGVLEFADGLTLLDGSTIDLDDPTKTGSILVSGGALTIADAATINIAASAATEGDPLTLFSISGSVAAADLSAVNFTLNGLAAAGTWTGNDFSITAVPVPEPATIALVLGALTALVALAARRRR